MNVKELAALLHGREYGSEITKAEEDQAKVSGLVVVFGASDDLMEWRGVIHDEIGGPGTAHLTSAGLLTNDCDNYECPHFELQKKAAATIHAVFDRDGYSWVYDTEIQHATFDIMEDGETYCRGIVFALASVK